MRTTTGLPVRLLALLLLGCAPRAARAQADVRVSFDEIPNLIYQLDCVSGAPVPCGKENYRLLWEREFLKTADDRAAVEEWARLRDRYDQSVRLKPTGEPAAPLPLSRGDDLVPLGVKLRVAGLQARDADDYFARLDLLTTPADRAAMERIVRRLLPAFSAWWRREAAPGGAEFASETQALLRSAEIATHLRRFRLFYGVALPADRKLSFALLYRPNLAREPTNGQLLDDLSLMEFLPSERPAERIDVAIHELCHFFYNSSTAADAARLRARFLADSRPSAVPV